MSVGAVQGQMGELIEAERLASSAVRMLKAALKDEKLEHDDKVRVDRLYGEGKTLANTAAINVSPNHCQFVNIAAGCFTEPLDQRN